MKCSECANARTKKDGRAYCLFGYWRDERIEDVERIEGECQDFAEDGE